MKTTQVMVNDNADTETPPYRSSMHCVTRIDLSHLEGTNEQTQVSIEFPADPSP